MWDEQISIFHRPRPQWEAAKMKAKTDRGGWTVFSYEGERSLNMTRPVPPVDNYIEFTGRHP